MFEKSKSEITFKEFESKMRMINNFENDWGHFYVPDFSDSEINNESTPIFKINLYKPKKETKK